MAKVVIKKAVKKQPEVVEEEKKDQGVETKEARTSTRSKKQCAFCTAKKAPSYTDSAALKRYMSDRARIYPKSKTGLCAKHQRHLAKEIKHARHLALLPFVPTV